MMIVIVADFFFLIHVVISVASDIATMIIFTTLLIPSMGIISIIFFSFASSWRQFTTGGKRST